MDNDRALSVDTETKVLDVLRLIRAGSKVGDALKEVGLNKNTYYLFLQDNPGIIEEINRFTAAMEAAEYVLLKGAELSVIEQLIERLQVEKNPKNIIEGLKYIQDRVPQLMANLEVSDEGDPAQAYLKYTETRTMEVRGKPPQKQIPTWESESDQADPQTKQDKIIEGEARDLEP